MGIYDQEGIAQELHEVTIAALEGEGFPAALRDATSQSPLDRALWESLMRVGLPTLLLSESQGGIGGGPRELAAVCDALGRRLVRAPVTEALVAFNLLAASGYTERLKEIVRHEKVTAIAAGSEAADWRNSPWSGAEWKNGHLTGSKIPVNFGADADVILVTCEADGEPAIVEVAIDGERRALVELLDTTDASYRPARLEFRRHPAQLITAGQDAMVRWREAEALARLGAVGELAGVAGALVRMAVEHAKDREQFGRPIGSFQAVKHLAADMHVSANNLVSLRNSLATELAESPGNASDMAASAKAQATRLSMEACERALQILGGIGFTAEHDLSLYYQRVLTLSDLWGTERDIELRIGRRILGFDAPTGE